MFRFCHHFSVDGDGNEITLIDGIVRPPHETAKILGISRSHISRIAKHAIQLQNEWLHKL